MGSGKVTEVILGDPKRLLNCEDMFSLFLAFLREWKVNNSVEYDISMGEFSNVLQFFLHSGVGTTATLPVHLQPTDNVMFI